MENPNKDQAYEDTMYQVAAYDENGVVIGDESGAIELLLPGQKLGSAGELSLPDGKTAARVEVQVLKGDPSTTTIMEMFTSENVTYVADKYFPKVTGVVKNLTDKTLEDIRVSAIAYNDAGQIVGGGYTYVDFVPANAQIAAEVRITTKEVPARVELYPVVTSLTSLAP